MSQRLENYNVKFVFLMWISYSNCRVNFTLYCHVDVEVSHCTIHELSAELFHPLIGAYQPVLLCWPWAHHHTPPWWPAWVNGKEKEPSSWVSGSVGMPSGNSRLACEVNWCSHDSVMLCVYFKGSCYHSNGRYASQPSVVLVKSELANPCHCVIEWGRGRPRGVLQCPSWGPDHQSSRHLGDSLISRTDLIVGEDGRG